MSTDSVSVNPSGLVWKNPPEIERDSKWRLIADELRQHPDQWAALPEHMVFNPNSMASNVRSGLSSVFRPAGSFEAKVRQGVVYVRFSGESSAAA